MVNIFDNKRIIIINACFCKSNILPIAAIGNIPTKKNLSKL